MELDIGGGVALKQFTRALACLVRFGEDLDLIATRERVSVSAVNSSRTAFGVVHFFPRFFQHFSLLDDSEPFKFSVTGKALLSPLRPRSANTIESCGIAVGSEDRNVALEPGVDAGECRIVIRLNCQHGVVKTHRLTYGNPNLNNWARFNQETCSSSWKASSKVLKEWMDHFYLRSGANALTDEITFYCGPYLCKLKSFNDTSSEQNMTENDIMSSRPLTTELSVDTDDYDVWDVPETQTITFALKEFKSIITFAEALMLPISAYFSTGGRPLMLQCSGDHLESKFVVATTDYDSGGVDTSGDGVKREKSESVSQAEERRRLEKGKGHARDVSEVAGENTRGRIGSTNGTGSRPSNGRPLFNAPTPSPAPQVRGGNEFDDEFDFGGMDNVFDDPDAAFAEIDHLSQVAMSQDSQAPRSENGNGRGAAPVGGARELVRDTSEARPSADSERNRRGPHDGDDERFEATPEPPTAETTFGPTQRAGDDRPSKRAKWNILNDG
ncbi:hypothetical protein JCM10212_001120 [Sporobolomyces blumeae]